MFLHKILERRDGLIYNNIKRISEKKGMSIRAVEKLAALGNGVIGGWKSSSPTVASLQAVARVLEVSVDELLKNKDA